MKNEVKTYDLLLDYLKKVTGKYKLTKNDVFSANSIAENLNISRTLTSQYLNMLFKNDYLIKISTRPVYFYSKEIIEKIYSLRLNYSEYYSFEELENEIFCLGKKDFSKAIGYYGSLADSIKQIKAALNYPNGGLPILITGEVGTGKKFLTNLIYEYLINNKLISKEKILCKVSSKLDDNLNQKTLLNLKTKTNIGLLCVEEIENYSKQSQNEILNFLNERKCWAVFTANKNKQDLLIKDLFLKIPVICNLTNYEQRLEGEKEEFIIDFFKKEEEILNRQIYISDRFLDRLKNYQYTNNLLDIEKIIKNICSKKYFKNTPQIYINLSDLPIEYFKNTIILENDIRYIKISDYTITKTEKVIDFLKEILNIFDDFQFENIKDTFLIIRKLYDYLLFDIRWEPQKLEIIESNITYILDKFKTKFDINIPINFADILSRILLYQYQNNSALKEFENIENYKITQIKKYLKNIIGDELIYAQEIIKNIYLNFELDSLEMIEIFLAINIHYYNEKINNLDTIGLIINHGYMTASSIADTVNTLLTTKVFEAIDMPLNISSEKIFSKVNDFIAHNPFYKNIIILVDMGSLENIGDIIKANVNVGIINNISTSVALNIGNRILNRNEMETILKQAQQESVCTYKIISRAKQENAVVFISDEGIKVSERISKLFKDSLPKDIELKFIEVNYEDNNIEKLNQSIFKKYNVILIVKPSHLNFANYKQVTLENIINNKEIDKVNLALKKYLNSKEIIDFNQKIIKNFSLLSIIDNTMILNSKVLLDNVYESIEILQRKIKRKLFSKTLVGLYMHMCFLIERLVMNSETKNVTIDLDNEEFKKFKPKLLDSCSNLFKKYNIQFPDYEIAYIYQYIENEKGDIENDT